MSFPRYPKYKDSGVEWLGEVPEGWEIKRIKATVSECRNGIWGDEPNGDEWDIACLRVADFDRDRLRVCSPVPTLRNVGRNERQGRMLRPGDLLLEKSGGGDRQPVGCVALVEVDEPAVCSNFVARMSVTAGFDSSYCRYLHAAMYALRLTTRSINQTSGIQNLDQQSYLNEPVALPGLDEQIAIATFLEHETAKIDALFKEQRRLIDLLKEKRQAVITHAVAGRLLGDTDRRFKMSAIDWMGEVPLDWIDVPLKWLTEQERPIMYGIVLPGPDVGEGIPILKGGNVKPHRMCLEEMARTTPEIEEPFARARLKAGDLAYSIRGTIGDCEEVPPSLAGANITQDVARIAPSEKVERRWIRWSLLCNPVRERLACGSLGAAVRGINIADLKRAKILLPPVSEQRKISDLLDEEDAQIRGLMAVASENMRLLQERRSALISAAVTGKIDVRQPVKKPVASVKPYNSGFAHQLLAATILGRCNDKHMGRVKLQKLIHVTEYHAQIEDLKGEYTRQMAGPLDMKAMAGLERGLEKQHWYKTVREGQRYRYQPLGKKDQHQKYLEQWADKQNRINEVLTLMGGMNMRQCEIVSTLYAAWNDLLIDGLPATDDAILDQAATAEGWHESKERTPRDKWVAALQWMRQNALIPTGFGSHTRKASPEGIHEPA